MEYIQRDFEESITKPGIDLSYKSAIVPWFEKVMSLIGDDPFKWPLRSDKFNVIDIYYETVYHYYTLHIDKPFPFNLLVMLMIYRPFIYYVVCLTKEYKELDKLNEQIINEIAEIFKNSDDNEYVIRLKDIMKIKHISPDKMSSLAYLHYLIGFKFNGSMIGINRRRLDEIAQENHANVIKINVLHNLPFNRDDVYVYAEMKEKIGFRFLTPEVVERFKPIKKTNVPNSYQYDKLFSYEKVTDANMFVLNYNDNDFTILTKDDKPYIMNEKNSRRFMNGALPMLISNRDFINYAEQTYNELIPRFISSNKTLEDIELPRFAQIYKEHIQQVLQDTKINTKFHLSKFCDRLIDVLDECMDKTDKSLFVFYCRLYTWTGTFNKHEFVEYMKSYFDPPEV